MRKRDPERALKYIHETYSMTYAIVIIDGEEVELTPHDPRWPVYCGSLANAYSKHLADSLIETSTLPK